MVAILFYPRGCGVWVGVRNDQTVGRDRGVQYGLHTGTGLCRCLKGVGGWGTVPQRPVCLSPPQNRNVTASVREKKKRDGSGGVGGEEWVQRGTVCPRKDSGHQGS